MSKFKYKEQDLKSINPVTHPHLRNVESWYLVWEIGIFEDYEEYAVYISKVGKFTHLRIKRVDNQPVHKYMDMQQIKNDLLGPETIAVEVYPKESDFVNGSNTYHLWSWEGMEVPDLNKLYQYIK